MALAKVDKTKILKTCSLTDGAIDKEATGPENMKNFEESYDISFLKFKQGENPTIFHISNIMSMDEAKIKQDHIHVTFPDFKKNALPSEMRPTIKQVNGQEMIIKYFNMAVKKYEEGGQIFDCDSDTFSYTIVQEMGSIAMMRAQVGDDLKNVLKS